MYRNIALAIAFALGAAGAASAGMQGQGGKPDAPASEMKEKGASGEVTKAPGGGPAKKSGQAGSESGPQGRGVGEAGTEAGPPSQKLGGVVPAKPHIGRTTDLSFEELDVDGDGKLTQEEFSVLETMPPAKTK